MVDLENGQLSGTADFEYDDEILVIPSYATSIAENAFFGNSNIKTIDFSQNSLITTIPNNAFRGCSNLTEIIFSDSITTICYNAFFQCTSLETLNLPDTITSIGSYAFYECKKLKYVSLPENEEFTTLDDYIFGTTAIETIELPDNITTLKNAVIGSEYLESITISKNITSLSGAFSGCENLEEIIIDTENQYMKSVEGIVYSKDGTVLMQNPTANDKVVNIPNTVLTITSGAFKGTAVSEINISSSVTSITSGEFGNCDNLTTLTVDANSESYSAENNVLYNKSKTVLMACANVSSITVAEETTNVAEHACMYTSNLEEVDMSNSSISRIANRAFYSNNKLETVKFSDVLTHIESEAFRSCAFTKIELPEGVTYIDRAFGTNTYLETVIFPSTLNDTIAPLQQCYNISSVQFRNSDGTTYTDRNSTYLIEDNGIYDINKTKLVGSFGTLNSYTSPSTIKSLENYSLEGVYLEEVELNTGLETIGTNVFIYNYNLTKITIPSTVNSIGTDCFVQTKSLTQIIIEKEEDSITGAPWGATKGILAVNWNG